MITIIKKSNNMVKFNKRFAIASYVLIIGGIIGLILALVNNPNLTYHSAAYLMIYGLFILIGIGELLNKKPITKQLAIPSCIIIIILSIFTLVTKADNVYDTLMCYVSIVYSIFYSAAYLCEN